MILDTLIKVKRQSIIIAILLMGAGIVMLLCPEKYIPSLIMVSGYIMIIYAMEQTLEFLGGENTLMQCISFVLAIIVGLVGLGVLVFHEDVLSVLSWIFGLVLVLEGKSNLHYAFRFAKPSGRQGWSILVIFGLLLLAAGVMLIVGEMVFTFAAFEKTKHMMRMIGIALLVTSLISVLKILWINPKNGGGESDAE